MDERAPRLVVVVATGMDEYQCRLFAGMSPVFAAAEVAQLVFVNSVHGIPSLIWRVLSGSVTPSGLITMNSLKPREEESIHRRLTSLGIPAVHIGGKVTGATCVRGDNATGMRQLMAHLLDECGVRRPALILGIRHQPDSVERERIFRQELLARDLAFDEGLVVEGAFREGPSYHEVRSLLGRRRDMDAFVALNDLSAMGAWSAITECGLRVPHDVLLTGFDNAPLSSLHWPGLTTVDQDLEGQGRAAAQCLLAEMDGGSPVGEKVVPASAVVRGSTGLLHQPVEEQLADAAATAQQAQARLSAQDGMMSLSRSIMECHSLDEIANTLAGRLGWMGITRCFVSAYEDAWPRDPSDPVGRPGPGTGTLHGAVPGPPSGGAVRGTWPGPAAPDESADVPVGAQARLVLDFRHGRDQPLDDSVYRTEQLLPPSLAGQLRSGSLTLQMLWLGDRQLGFVLFDRDWSQESVGQVMTIQVLTMDVTRALDTVFARRQLEEHAALLEATVARRTADLRNEVSVRRRTEQELHEEVVIRRKAEAELQRANKELQRSLMLDGLTRIANRIAFQRHLDDHWQLAAQQKDEIALLILDVDLFKAYNDHYGHLMGDEALRTFATCLDESVREPRDLACRYGGEEFAVLLPGAGVKAALTVARRFRSRLTEAAIAHAGSIVAPVLTASIGVAVVRAGGSSTTAELIEAADRALYRAKAQGRNRVALASAEDAAGGAPAAEEGWAERPAPKRSSSELEVGG